MCTAPQGRQARCSRSQAPCLARSQTPHLAPMSPVPAGTECQCCPAQNSPPAPHHRPRLSLEGTHPSLENYFLRQQAPAEVVPLPHPCLSSATGSSARSCPAPDRPALAWAIPARAMQAVFGRSACGPPAGGWQRDGEAARPTTAAAAARSPSRRRRAVMGLCPHH